MISDFRTDMVSYSAKSEINDIYQTAKVDFNKDIPFSIMKTGTNSGSYPVIESKFFTKLNFALDYSTEGTTVVMSDRERKAWYDFIEYQDGRETFSKTEEMVVKAIDEGIVAEIMGISTMNESLQTENYMELIHSNGFTGFD